MKWQQRFSTPAHKRQYVRTLFSTIADRYDLITVLLSGGLDRRWKRRLVNRIDPGGESAILDLACGTGDIAFAAASRARRVVGLDITLRMLQIASRKAPAQTHRVAFLAGDMMSLPFADARFDVVTTGYGLRNVPDLEGALSEIRRVLKPGGRMLALDFDKPPNRFVRGVYLGYLTMVGSALGWGLHGDPDTYRYIPESIKRYPGAAGVSAIARQAGFASCEHTAVLGGLMAMHSATK